MNKLERALSNFLSPGEVAAELAQVLAPALFKEKCQQCGECLLGRFAGICPLTQCAKGLLNGPCGGSQGGKCEVDPERDCAWALIIERLERLGMIDVFEEIVPPKDWSKMERPRKIEVAPLVLE